jgi:hypothetical protein
VTVTCQAVQPKNGHLSLAPPVAHACNPSYMGEEICRIAVQGQPGQIVLETAPPPHTHLQNNQSKLDWRHGSSGRVPSLQAQSTEFKPQSHQKKEEKSHKKKNDHFLWISNSDSSRPGQVSVTEAHCWLLKGLASSPPSLTITLGRHWVSGRWMSPQGGSM